MRNANKNYGELGMEFETESTREQNCPGCLGPALYPILGKEFLSRCSDCGLVFDNPRPSADAITAFYSQESQYDGWIRELEDRNRLWARRIRKMRRHRIPGSLLDVGTGIGQFLSMARTEYSTVQGTEVSSTAIQHAKRLYELEILQGTIESLHIGQQFDNVTAFHVLEHVHRPLEFLKCCNQLLKPRGRLFLAVPNDIEALDARIGRFSLVPIKLPTPEIHLSHFTVKSMAKLLHLSDFELIDLSLDPFWVCSLSREPLQALRYYVMGALCRLTGINLYPTIWAVAQKSLHGVQPSS